MGFSDAIILGIMNRVVNKAADRAMKLKPGQSFFTRGPGRIPLEIFKNSDGAVEVQAGKNSDNPIYREADDKEEIREAMKQVSVFKQIQKPLEKIQKLLRELPHPDSDEKSIIKEIEHIINSENIHDLLEVVGGEITNALTLRSYNTALHSIVDTNTPEEKIPELEEDARDFGPLVGREEKFIEQDIQIALKQRENLLAGGEPLSDKRLLALIEEDR